MFTPSTILNSLTLTAGKIAIQYHILGSAAYAISLILSIDNKTDNIIDVTFIIHTQSVVQSKSNVDTLYIGFIMGSA